MIYVCEQWHDNDCGIFSTFEAANAHFVNCQCHLCECIQEYELVGDEFKRTDRVVYRP